MRLKHFLSVFLTLLTLSVGQTWGAATTVKWVQVTAAPSGTATWDGEYLLVYQGTSTTAGVAWTGADAASCGANVTISSGVIASKPDAAASLTIASITNGYSIKVNGGSLNGKYIGGTSGSNTINSGTNAILNTISYNATNKSVITSNTSVMRYNSANNNLRFRYFKSASYSSQQKVELYKQVTLSSISVRTAPTKTAYTEGESFAPAGLVIRKTWSDNSTEDITYNNTTASDFTFSPSTALTTGNTSVSITYGGKSTSQAITVEASGCSNSITIGKGTESHGTFTLSKSGSQATCSGLSVVVTPDADDHYHVSSVSATTGETGTDNGDGTWTITYAANTTGSSTINVVFAEDPAATISFENAGTPAPTTTGYYVDDSYTLPSSNNYSCSGGKTFVGWSTVPVASQNSKPSSNFYEPGESVTLGASQTFYAVFATDAGGSTEDEWVETAISSLTSSDIFVLSDGSYAFTNDNGTSAAPSAVAITVASSKITSTVNVNMKWNISGNGTDGYVFYPNGSTTTWLYCSTTNATGSNNNIRVGDGARKYFVLDEAGDLVTNDTYADRYLRNYSNSDLRGYVNKDYGTAVAPHCYRFVEGSQSYIDYSTNCCTELASINGSFFWSTLFEPLIPDKFRSHVLLCNHLFSSSHHRIPPHLIYTMYISRDFGFF